MDLDTLMTERDERERDPIAVSTSPITMSTQPRADAIGEARPDALVPPSDADHDQNQEFATAVLDRRVVHARRLVTSLVSVALVGLYAAYAHQVDQGPLEAEFRRIESLHEAMRSGRFGRVMSESIGTDAVLAVADQESARASIARLLRGHSIERPIASNPDLVVAMDSIESTATNPSARLREVRAELARQRQVGIVTSVGPWPSDREPPPLDTPYAQDHVVGLENVAMTSNVGVTCPVGGVILPPGASSANQTEVPGYLRWDCMSRGDHFALPNPWYSPVLVQLRIARVALLSEQSWTRSFPRLDALAENANEQEMPDLRRWIGERRTRNGETMTIPILGQNVAADHVALLVQLLLVAIELMLVQSMAGITSSKVRSVELAAWSLVAPGDSADAQAFVTLVGLPLAASLWGSAALAQVPWFAWTLTLSILVLALSNYSELRRLASRRTPT